MITFRSVVPSRDSQNINTWRSDPRIANVSRTKFTNTVKQQEEYLERKSNDVNWVHWIICVNNKDIGYVNFSMLLRSTSAISWGFYIGDDDYLGLGAVVAASFYNLIFSKTNVLVIQAEVLGHNHRVRDMHLKMGYVIKRVHLNIETHNMRSTSEVEMLLEKDTWKSPRNPLGRMSFSFETPIHSQLWKSIATDD